MGKHSIWQMISGKMNKNLVIKRQILVGILHYFLSEFCSLEKNQAKKILDSKIQ